MYDTRAAKGVPPRGPSPSVNAPVPSHGLNRGTGVAAAENRVNTRRLRFSFHVLFLLRDSQHRRGPHRLAWLDSVAREVSSSHDDPLLLGVEAGDVALFAKPRGHGRGLRSGLVGSSRSLLFPSRSSSTRQSPRCSCVSDRPHQIISAWPPCTCALSSHRAPAIRSFGPWLS